MCMPNILKNKMSNYSKTTDNREKEKKINDSIILKVRLMTFRHFYKDDKSNDK